VIREIVVEPPSPPTLPTPTSNANTVIITTPGGDPPAPSGNDDVVVTPPTPPSPVIPIEPSEPSPPPVIEPVGPPITFEYDPWWGGIPRFYGNLWQFGGTLGGDNLWTPSYPPQIGVITTDAIPSPNPTASPPIVLENSFSSLENFNQMAELGGRADFDPFLYSYKDK
jgi:hypothetical protein